MTFVENSMDSYLRMMTNEIKSVKYFYKNFSLLRDIEVGHLFFILQLCYNNYDNLICPMINIKMLSLIIFVHFNIIVVIQNQINCAYVNYKNDNIKILSFVVQL